MDEGSELAEALKAGVQSLREGRWAEAASQLQAVVDHPRFARAKDLGDIRARASSLLAQALLRCGRLREAEARAEAALRQVRILGDTEGIHEIGVLIAEIREQATRAAAEPPAARAPADLASARAVRDPSLRAEALLQLATGKLSAGDRSGALEAARAAWEEAAPASRDRVVVLARLCAAHAEPERAAEHLAAAWSAADASAEAEHLLGPVARAAEVLELPLPSGSLAHVGGRP